MPMFFCLDQSRERYEEFEEKVIFSVNFFKADTEISIKAAIFIQYTVNRWRD